jgi:hypothetical protein
MKLLYYLQPLPFESGEVENAIQAFESAVEFYSKLIEFGNAFPGKGFPGFNW